MDFLPKISCTNNVSAVNNYPQKLINRICYKGKFSLNTGKKISHKIQLSCCTESQGS